MGWNSNTGLTPELMHSVLYYTTSYVPLESQSSMEILSLDGLILTCEAEQLWL